MLKHDIPSSIIQTAGAQVARESHVPEEMGRLRGALADLEKEWSGFVQRLAPVMNHEDGKEEAPALNQAPDAYRVPLAEEIRQARRAVEAVIGYVRATNASLEV